MMWLCTKHGFVSAVGQKDDPGLLMLRARKRDNLVELLKVWRAGELPELIETPCADCRWRRILPRTSFVELAARLADDIVDPNFKDGAQKEHPSDHKYHTALGRTWSIAASGLIG